MFYDDSLLKALAVKAVDLNMKLLLRSKNSAELNDNSLNLASTILTKIVVLQSSNVQNELTDLVEEFILNIHSQLACAIENEVRNIVINFEE